METIAAFVARTRGPVVPFVDDWYPWAYAHHYLRIEMESVSPELGPALLSLRVDNAIALIRRWCAVTGEDVDDAVHLLADAYLERWGLAPPAAPDPVADEVTAPDPVPQEAASSEVTPRDTYPGQDDDPTTPLPIVRDREPDHAVGVAGR